MSGLYNGQRTTWRAQPHNQMGQLGRTSVSGGNPPSMSPMPQAQANPVNMNFGQGNGAQMQPQQPQQMPPQMPAQPQGIGMLGGMARSAGGWQPIQGQPMPPADMDAMRQRIAAAKPSYAPNINVRSNPPAQMTPAQAALMASYFK